MPPKKKLSKKERARMEAEQAELLRIEMEKEKQRKLEEERRRREIERQQAIERQREEIDENKKRRAQLKSSMAFFNAIKTTIETLNETAKEQRDWEKFMRCNGLPTANSPSDLRKYMHQWRSDIELRNKNSRNWLLQTDERTLLTQDANVLDLSRTALRKMQGNLGDTYAQRIREVLGILIEIDEAIDDKKNAIHIIRDLQRLKTEIRLFLKEYLDEFTYKTMSHIERDMEIDRPGVYRHIYISDVYKSHVWTYSKDAQLTANAKARIGEQNQHINVIFPTVAIEILLPPSVILYNSAMRGLWLNFDHFSDYCPSFNLKKPTSKNIDILHQTKKEWRKRKEILKNLIDECSLQSPILIPEPSTMESSTPKKRKERNFDIDKMYMEYEEELNKLHKLAIGPEAYNLLDTDVNLRKYRIIGGVYCIDHIETPDQDKRLNARSFIRTIVAPDKLALKDFHQFYRPPPAVQPGVRRLPEEIEAEMRMIEAALDKLPLVTVQLPDTVIWFEPPIACRWETHIETLQSNLADGIKPTQAVIPNETTSTTNASVQRSSAHFLSKLYTEGSQNPAASSAHPIVDFDLLNVPKKKDVYGLVKDFVAPRLPQGFTFQSKESNDYIPPQRADSPSPQHRILFLTRYKNINLSSPLKDNIKADDAMTLNYEKRKINQSSIDLKEPQALFPTVQLNKMLMFKEESDEKKVLERNKLEQRDSNAAGQKRTTYMFSELIEDLNYLTDIQLPLEAELEDHSTSTYPTNAPSVDGSEMREQPSNADPMEQMLSAYGRIPGLPLLRNIELKSDNLQITTAQSDDDDSSSAFEDEWENDDNNITHHDENYDGQSATGNMNKSRSGSNSSEIKKGQVVGIDLFQRGKWSTRDVHDVKFNEDKFSIQFRTGRFGIFGFALNRYSNMPYQTWEIKPDFKTPNTILFSLTASIVSIEITITPAGYCMNSFQGGSTEAINSLIGKICSLTELKNTLITSAVDVFPDQDAFCYTEGSCEKNYLMEMHLYACISTLTLSHNFGWSRWNLLAGNRTVVLLMRELIEGKKVPYHSTLLVTPLKTAIIDCTEVSASFNTAGIAGMNYYADLYQLSQDYALASSLEKQRSMDPILRDNVACLLMATRPLSLC